ncbi:MAG: hypothetical protein JWN45_1874 [Acidobacteriaceae bacterium]|nr:hypothetical protein [Acidobacteriaceae bacterium]
MLPNFIHALRFSAVLLSLFTLFSLAASAQENYFVTYSHQLEEPGNLEIATRSVTASPKGGNLFIASALEFEYGVKAWWTSELYLDGQSTARESTVFTGYRWENRFRPLLREHWINPVLYVEFANVNGADKTMLEVVGHDGNADANERNDRSEKKREMELRLIGSSNLKGWNISENFIAEKNLTNEPWEFGYALGFSRPLSLAASANVCTFCKENVSLGAEMYGGLGDRYSFGLHDTSHYLAPVASLQTPAGITFKVSPGFGLNSNSNGFLFRFGVSYEIEQILSKLRGR